MREGQMAPAVEPTSVHFAVHHVSVADPVSGRHRFSGGCAVTAWRNEVNAATEASP
jgi:hypothetical protein